jgi:sulfoxide reductase heme-binding subunit YedZ
MLALWLKSHYRRVWWLVFIASAWPVTWLAWRYAQDDLGVNGLQTLQFTTGDWALNFLILTLAVTPLRRLLAWSSRHMHLAFGKRLADWNWIIRLRRQLGLWCFAYALAHGFVYLHFDLGYEWSWLVDEIGEKPFLLAGATGLALLIPLAATSTNAAMRALGPNWRRLHRLTYALALVAVAHYWWLTKPGLLAPLPATLLIAGLLGYRVLAHYGLPFRMPIDDGMLVPDDVRTGIMSRGMR